MAEQVKPEVKEEGPKKPVVDEAKKKAKDDLLKKIHEVLTEYGGKESDIPISHDYWNLVNRYRAE